MKLINKIRRYVRNNNMKKLEELILEADLDSIHPDMRMMLEYYMDGMSEFAIKFTLPVDDNDIEISPIGYGGINFEIMYILDNFAKNDNFNLDEFFPEWECLADNYLKYMNDEEANRILDSDIIRLFRDSTCDIFIFKDNNKYKLASWSNYQDSAGLWIYCSNDNTTSRYYETESYEGLEMSDHLSYNSVFELLQDRYENTELVDNINLIFSELNNKEKMICIDGLKKLKGKLENDFSNNKLDEFLDGDNVQKVLKSNNDMQNE